MAKKKTSKKTSTSKKTTAKKSSTKKTTKKAASSGSASKKTTKKTAASTAKKSSTKKTTKKAASSDSGSKKTTKKTPAKTGSTQAAKPDAASKKTSSSKTASKKAETKKPDTKKAETKKVETAKTDASSKAAPARGGESKTGRKGITIVDKKPMRKSTQKKTEFRPPSIGSILGGGQKPPKPLIPSGPSEDDATAEADASDKPIKTPFKKRELDKYRQLLLDERARTLGALDAAEGMALRGESGSLSHTPQHLADQGSETADQSLSLDLAAADRRKIRDIDEALHRISEGIYGVCEITRKPIEPERLEEIPWTRYSMEGARLAEQRQYGR